MIYQSMGNIGAMSAYIDRNGASKLCLGFAVMATLLTYYLMYMACYQFWTYMAFSSTFSSQLNDSYFFYINTIELLSFIFIRTRSSIKYFPKFITIANLMFLFYINSFMYPCQFEALNVLQWFSMFTLTYFMQTFEWEAMNNWSPFGHWTPSENNPRCGYHDVILSSEYSIGFDVFSMTMPLRFRERFSLQSQSSFEILA